MKNLTILVLILSNLHLNAQNLVPNHSFEEIDSCGFGIGYIPIGWSSATMNGTPDTYNACATDPQQKVPNVLSCENLPAKTGDGYVGVIVYGNYSREYLQVKLTQKLVKDEWYYLEFNVSPTLGCGTHPSYSDAIGMAFATTLLNYDLPSGVLPHDVVLENQGTVIDNVGEWTTLSTCYQAKGDEEVIVIGSFVTNEETVIVDTDPNPGPIIQEYFFLDDVKVIPFNPLPDLALICEDEIELDGYFLDTTLTWSTGEVGNTITIDEGGYYHAQIWLDGCLYRDSIEVVDLRTFQTFDFQDTICIDATEILSPNMPGDYIWSTGFTLPSISVNTSGLYTATVANECDTYEFNYDIVSKSCECSFLVPNMFSPNDDGHNDVLKYFSPCALNMNFERFMVFDRWGNPVFSSTSMNDFWDGKSNGQPLNTGVYVWFAEYLIAEPSGNVRKVASGDVTLVR